MSPEAELLLSCARVRLEQEDRARIETLVRRGLDWKCLLELAAAHELSSLLYWHLKAVCPEDVPEEARQTLRDRVAARAAQGLLLTSELFPLLDLLGRAGIPAIPFKGPVLAAALYGNPALREFVDLDILIHRKDVPKALRVLASSGYRPTEEDEGMRFREWNRQCPLSRDGAGLLDLHWGLAQANFPKESSLSGVWDRLEPAVIDGRQVPTISAEDLCVFLCVHAAKHQWASLKWVCDLAELVRSRPDMQWQRVLERARAAGSERMVLLGLALARNVLGAEISGGPVPFEVDSGVRSLARNIHARLLSGVDPEGGAVEKMFFQFKISDSMLDKLRYLLLGVTVPTDADQQSLPLPPLLYPLYCLLRPLRLAAKYSRRALANLL